MTYIISLTIKTQKLVHVSVTIIDVKIAWNNLKILIISNITDYPENLYFKPLKNFISINNLQGGVKIYLAPILYEALFPIRSGP